MNESFQPQEQILAELDSIKNILLERKKPFLSIDEASLYLGISKNTLYSYTSRAVIPFHKPLGRRIYFSIDDLNEFILNKKNRSSSQEEIERIAVTKVVAK